MTDPTDGERAAFEAGIKFGALYHQFAGTPVSPRSADSLATAMEAAIENQPFCTGVDVRPDENRIREAIGAGDGGGDDAAADPGGDDAAADPSDDGAVTDSGDGGGAGSGGGASGADSEEDATATDVADYTELTGTLYDATVEIERAGTRVRAELATEDDYPLMRLAAVERE